MFDNNAYNVSNNHNPADNYTLLDICPYIQRFNVPLCTHSVLASIGKIISVFLGISSTKFKVNCQISNDEYLMNMQINTLSIIADEDKNSTSNISNNHFYVLFNIQNTVNRNIHHSLLYKYANYSGISSSIATDDRRLFTRTSSSPNIRHNKSFNTHTFNLEDNFERGSRLDFNIDGGAIDFIVFAQAKKYAFDHRNGRKIKHESGSKSLSSYLSMSSFSSCSSFFPQTNNKYPMFHSMPSPNINRNIHTKHSNHNNPHSIPEYSQTNSYGNRNEYQSIHSDVAVIYPQNNILMTYFHGQSKILDNNCWQSILCLWRQTQSNIVYMLRGSKRNRNTHEITFDEEVNSPEILSYKYLYTKYKRTKKPRSGSLDITDIIDQHRRRPRKKKRRCQSASTNKRQLCDGKKKKRRNPCRLYEIRVDKYDIMCEKLFDFPSENNATDFAWFDIQTQSLFCVVNIHKCIQLKIVKQNIVVNESTTPTMHTIKTKMKSDVKIEHVESPVVKKRSKKKNENRNSPIMEIRKRKNMSKEFNLERMSNLMLSKNTSLATLYTFFQKRFLFCAKKYSIVMYH